MYFHNIRTRLWLYCPVDMLSLLSLFYTALTDQLLQKLLPDVDEAIEELLSKVSGLDAYALPKIPHSQV